MEETTSAMGGITDLLKYGIGRWVDQDTQRRVMLNDAAVYRQTADGRTVSGPGSDVAGLAQTLQNPWVLGLTIAGVIGLGVWLARR